MGNFLKSPGPGKWLALALVVSLALNLFLGGAFAGRWMRPHYGPWAASSGAPEADAFVQRQRAEWRQRMVAVTEARHELRQVLIANPADKAAVDRASAKIVEQVGEARKALHRGLAEKAATLAPDEREKFINAIFERRGPFWTYRPDPPL